MLSRTEARPPTADKQAVVNAWWDGDDVVALMRTPSGGTEERRMPARYCHYLKADDVTEQLERQLRNSRYIAGVKREGSWWRVTWRDWRLMKKAVLPEGLFHKLRVPTYEADLQPVKRWLIESGVPIAKPRRCYIDLELDTRHTLADMVAGLARVLCWSIVDHDTGETISGVLEADTDEAEAELLKDFWYELRAYEQVAAWNGDPFDFEVLKNRGDVMEVRAPRKRWLWVDHLAVYRRLNMSAAESGDEKQSMALGAVAKALLGEGKSPVDASKSYEYWAAGGEKRRELATYCARDAQLMRLIELETGYLELNQTVCEVCGVLPNTRGADPTNFVEGYLLRLARTRDVHFRSHFRLKQQDGKPWEEPEAFAGAYVMEPTRTGIIENAHVCDFASLYPSIIISWNISPDTYRPDVVLREKADGRPAYLAGQPLREYPRPADVCEAPITNVCFQTDRPGVLPIAIAELLRLRKEWKKRKEAAPPGTPEWKTADRRSTAYKIAANSFYGVMGSPFSRFYERAVAESVSTTGEWLIKGVIRAGEERGIEGFYGDTDSVFSVGVTRQQFAAFVDWCNSDLFPGMLRSKGCQENTIKLSYEKEFSVLVLISKKRYAGRYAHFGGTDATADSKPEIKGLEYKRGDTARLTRELQRSVIQELLYGGAREPAAYEALVGKARQHILEGVLPIDDIAISKKLTKPIEEYRTKTKKDGGDTSVPAHVAVAKLLNERGRNLAPGARISYVVTDASKSPQVCIPAEDYTGECDRFYLWENLVYPATQRVLESAFPGSRWKELLRVRPRKERAKKVELPTNGVVVTPSKKRRKTAPEGQTGLF